MAGALQPPVHAKTYIPVGRRQDNPCLPCLAPAPLHSTIRMVRNSLHCPEEERACVLISITGWHGVSNSGRDCQCFPDMAPLARLKTRSVNRDGLERSRAGLAWAAVSTQKPNRGLSTHRVPASHRRQHAKLSPHGPWSSVFALQC